MRRNLVLATVLAVLLVLLVIAVGGPGWAMAMGAVGGFLVVLLVVGTRE